MKNTVVQKLLKMIVSVPLSGLTSVNMYSSHFIPTVIFVSVPLSGLTSVNKMRLKRWLVAQIVSVPLSGLTSVNSGDEDDWWDVEIGSFRPLIGVNFCKLKLQRCF